MARDDEFTEFVALRGSALRRTAFLMTGDWHAAEDLTQTALARLYVAWSRVRLDGAEAYARAILARARIDAERQVLAPGTSHRTSFRTARVWTTGSRTGWTWAGPWRRCRPSNASCWFCGIWDDMSVEEVARALNISPGTVKSRASRALEALRSLPVTDTAIARREVQS